MKTRSRIAYLPFKSQLGLSLIELMVGVAIATLAMLIIVQAFSNNQIYQRSTQGSSDAQQTGNVLGRYLTRMTAEAGSALTASQGIWGCRLRATIQGTALHPHPAYAAPFSNVPVPLRLAPAVAVSTGTANPIDTLIISAGRPAGSTQDFGGSYLVTLNLNPNPSIGFNPNDFLLTYQLDEASNTVGDCNLVRIASTFTQSPLTPVIPGLGSRAIGPAATSVSLAANYGQPVVTGEQMLIRNLGQSPSYIALTVDNNGSLQMLDLLDRTVTPQIIAENVVAFKVLYGFDADNNNVISANEWVEPTGALQATVLLNGTQPSASLFSRILALRINYAVRGSQVQVAEVATAVPTPKTIQLFPDRTPAFPAINMTGVASRYQYQVFDITVPLTNPRSLQ